MAQEVDDFLQQENIFDRYSEPTPRLLEAVL